MHADNGTISQAVWELGALGAFIMPLVLVMYMHLFDKAVCGLARNMPGPGTTSAASLAVSYIGAVSPVSLQMTGNPALQPVIRREGSDT